MVEKVSRDGKLDLTQSRQALPSAGAQSHKKTSPLRLCVSRRLICDFA